MEKGKLTVIKLLIVLISFCLIDRGITLFISGNNVQNIFSLSHTNDLEIPHQQHLLNFTEDEEWMEINKFDTSCLNLNSIEFLSSSEFVSQEFADSIWQPPKFV
jgi:hypothetical protein